MVIAIIAVTILFMRLYNAENVSEAKTINVSTEDIKSVSEGSEVLLMNKYDTVSFNLTTNCANYVKWHVSKSRVLNDGISRKQFPFVEDDNPSIPKKNRITTRDYNNSGYDRGHLCPAADCNFNQQAMEECMKMTNIIPQDKILNRGSWGRLEDRTRQWSVNTGNDIYVVAGPLFTKAPLTFIGTKHKVAVPDKCFKVLCMMPKKGLPKTIGFIMDNDGSANKLEATVCSVNDIERITGYNFFEWLPDDIEEEIESDSDFQKWK